MSMEEENYSTRRGLADKLKRQMETAETLQAENETLNNNLRKLMQLLQTKDNELMKMKQQVSQIDNSEVDYLNQRLIGCQQKYLEIEMSFRSKEQECLQIAQKLEESYHALRHLKKEYDILAQENQHKSNQINALQSKMEEYEVSVELLHVQLNHHIQQSRISVQESSSETMNSRISTSRSNKKVSQLEDQVARLKSQNLELTKEAIELNEQFSQCNHFAARCTELTAALADANREKINLMRELTIEHESKLKLEKDCQHYSEKIKRQEVEIVGYKDKLQALSKEIKSYGQKDSLNAELTNALADLNREKINMMRELTLEHESRLKLEKECVNMQDKLKSQESELIGYQDQLEVCMKVIKQLDNKVIKQRQ